MEECKWSIKILSLYVQAPKSGGIQIVYKDKENQYRARKMFRIHRRRM